MFTKGQGAFALFFVIVFVIAMIYAYRKDLVLHKQFYRGNYKVLIAFFVFIVFLFFIKFYFKH